MQSDKMVTLEFAKRARHRFTRRADERGYLFMGQGQSNLGSLICFLAAR